MEPVKISERLLKRLPVYLEHLKSLPGEDGNISATTIAAALGLGHVLVRKDLAIISGEGRRRTGRARKQLIRDIEDFLEYLEIEQ
jgi:redox-sensing transcriptional repressor